MNYIDISDAIMHGERIDNIHLRVCFYARVSSDSDVQLNSLENQINYYENYIKSKPRWIYVKGYIDEGISGVRVEKREAFKEMINDAKLGKFDLIITKEVSRFARDLEDSIHYIRILKESNVGIYFENQNLNTFDSNSELILNIMFNLAQEESKKLSSRIKFGHNQAIKKGHVLGSSNIIGYRKLNCKLIVDEKEAEFVKKVFELYSSGEYGLSKLGKQLAQIGYYNNNGKIYDKTTLKGIIKNPKYKGYYRGKTSEVIDYRTKKRIKIDDKKQLIYKSNDDIIPKIVSEEIWDKANYILKDRTEKYSCNNKIVGGLKYPFSSKIICMEHNTHFQRTNGSRNKKRPTWSCSCYLQHRLEACASPIIAEKDLYNIFQNIMNNIITEKSLIIEEMCNLYKENQNKDKYANEYKKIIKNMELIENKKSMVLDLVFNNDITKDELKEQFKKYEKELINLKTKKDYIQSQIEISNKNNNDIESISKSIEYELDVGLVKDFIRHFVDRIIVSKVKNNRKNIKMDIYLNLNDMTKTSIRESRKSDKEVYCENIKYNSIERLRSDIKSNSFIYNIYIE